MKLTHVGISNFRSIGEEFVTIDLTKKINLLVGANNCGKSNVLQALEWLGAKSKRREFIEVDQHRRAAGIQPIFSCQLAAESTDDAVLLGLNRLAITWNGRNDHQSIALSTNFDNLS